MKENYIDKTLVSKIMKRHKRNKSDYKGVYGHALIIGGQLGKIGAVNLMVQGALRAGVGKITAYVPECGLVPIHSAIPETMIELDPNYKILTRLPDTAVYSSIGIGCGMGMDRRTGEMLNELLNKKLQPLVLDADALNIMSENEEMLRKLDENCIITPHPKEFLRLVSQQYNVRAVIDQAELEKLQHELVHVTNATLVFKTHQTKVVTTNGKIYTNTIGTSALATAGTGDLLTGIITSLLAQGYEPEEAAIVAVYVHSYAGYLASLEFGSRSVIASDVANKLADAFKTIDSRS